MNMLLNLESPVTTAHRAKLAYIYVRQSTAGQVRQHQESTELQYRLVDRAALFGWPKERIEVIDDDLGKSGTSSDSRGGFQRLIAEIGLGKAGLVLSLAASRLAGNQHAWAQLLELCSLFGVLIADSERVYDPCAYHDRLLLGLSGIMSEAELHQIMLRLHQGERQKAARGELRVPLPAGLAYGRDGRIGFNPDEEVHARLLHLFAKFRELRSAKAVMRHFQEANFLVPVRPLDGPSPHDVVWRPASNARILQVLKNPAYAGAYVYGRRRRSPIGRRSGLRQGATEAVAIQDWPVCLKDAFPGYIDWEEFMANQRRLAGNFKHYDANRHGVPRHGNAMPPGIAICGRCGRRMGLHYRPARQLPCLSLSRRSASTWRAGLSGGARLGRRYGGRKIVTRSADNGRSSASERAMRRSGRAVNTMPSNPRTVWWQGLWSAYGRTSSGKRSSSTLNPRFGAASSRYRLPRRTALRLSRWVRIFPNCGMRRAWSSASRSFGPAWKRSP